MFSPTKNGRIPNLLACKTTALVFAGFLSQKRLPHVEVLLLSTASIQNDDGKGNTLPLFYWHPEIRRPFVCQDAVTVCLCGLILQTAVASSSKRKACQPTNTPPLPNKSTHLSMIWSLHSIDLSTREFEH